MLGKGTPQQEAQDRIGLENHLKDFRALLRYVTNLADHKLGYPVSLLTYLGIIDNQILGIKPGTLANVLLNNVGDPFKDSETSLMEVKAHERQLIAILEKYYGLSDDAARGYVTTGGTEGNFAGLWWSKRFLINTGMNALIEADDKIKLLLKEEQELQAQLKKIPNNAFQQRAELLQRVIDLRKLIEDAKNIVQELLTPTVFFAKGHTHYSIPKIAEILHLNVRQILPNDDGSLDLNYFKRELLLHLSAHPRSPVIVIANIGTTITGAIDNVPAIRKILDDALPKPLYTIHMDGALTGFVIPVIKPFGEVDNYFDAIGVNTLAFSAHKYPGLSQPCGVILAKKDFFEKAFEKSQRNVDYVGNINDITVTGSRSGLNVLMLFNALYTLGIDKGKHKLENMVNKNRELARYLYEELKKLYGEDKVFYPYHFNVMFPKPSLSIAKKYQLMLTGDRATICVLPNVSKKLIANFIAELKSDKEKEMRQGNQAAYSIVTLTKEHIAGAVKIFIRSFCDSEPITKHLHITHQDYEPFARAVVEKAAKEALSKVAVNHHNEIIAIAIAEDMANPFIPNLKHYSKLKPICELIDQLSMRFTYGRQFVPGKVLHLWIAAVSDEYRGHGISTEIDMNCISAAAQKGFNFAYAEFTNELSEKVTHQFKLLEICNRIKFDDFLDSNGERPFKGLSGAATSYVATIKPGIALDSLIECYQTTVSNKQG